MAETRLRGAALLLAILMIPGCAAKTTSELAGIDQEITRNILWRYHQDPGNRFKEIRVSCEGRSIALDGRVADSKAASEALQIALSEARGGTVNSRLEVRPR